MRIKSNSTIWRTFGYKAVAGDRDATGQLLEEYRPVLRSIAQKRISAVVRPRIGPSDIVQQTCAEVCGSISQVKATNGSQLWGWIRSVMFRNLVDIHRTFVSCKKRSALREKSLDDFSQSTSTPLVLKSPLDRVIQCEEAARLNEAIAKLTEAQAIVLRWRYYDGLSYQEIAIRLDRSVDAVRMFIRRAEQVLERELGRL